MKIASEAQRAIEKTGFYVLNEPSVSNIIAFLSEIGEIVQETDVRIRQDAKTYVSSPNEVPFHNDHPKVKHIAWRCIEQDKNDGGSLLVDCKKLISNLEETMRSELARVRLRCPELASMVPSCEYPLYNHETGQVFWAPWLLPAEVSLEQQAAIEFFSSQINSPSNHERIRLKRNEVLLVDNHRIVHGRAALSKESTRHLKRYWLSPKAA